MSRRLGPRARRRISSASARVYDLYTPTAINRPDCAQRKTERDHRADPEVEHVQGEQKNTGHTDRDGNADALHDRLHREPFLDRHDLVRGVDRRARRSVGRRDVGDAEDAGQDEEAECGRTRPCGDHGHDHEHRGDDRGVQDEP